MDLSAMLNDGPAEKKQSQASPERQSTQRSLPPTPSANGLTSGFPPSQTTPLYGPPPGAPLSRQTTGLTPLQTPSQGPPGSQYPFPYQTSQSPAVQQPIGGYPNYGAHPATTPGARPASHGYPSYPQPSPGQHGPQGHPPGMYAHQTSSHSPTPSSHHAQTPQSIRQSPLSAMSHAPPPMQHHPQYAHQHSQPSTPLGPPPPQYSRTSGQSFHDAQSPYHQRQSSGASNGMTAGSPAQHQPSIGNLLDSPSGSTRHSPHLRRTSDYLSQMDRERSVSVSPKTKVLPRALSQTSRQSSQQEASSARSSLQHQHSVASFLESPSHVTTHSQSSVAQPAQIPSHTQQSHGVTQAIPPYSATNQPPLAQSSLSEPNNHSQPQISIQHQPQRMDMNHLLTPASSVTSAEGQENMIPKQRKPQEAYQFMRPSPKPKRSNVAPPPASIPSNSSQQPGNSNSHESSEPTIAQDSYSHNVNPSQQRTTGDVTNNQYSRDMHMLDAKATSNKRSAEIEPSSQPPAKRGRSGRKHTEKPIWARLSSKNPMYNPKQDGASNGRAQQHVPPPAAIQQQQPKPSGQVQQPANGRRSQDDNYFPPGVDPERPWTDNPPLNRDLLQMQHCLGVPRWEKTVKYSEPIADMQRLLMDWLYRELSQLKDIPNDKRVIEIEIEGKIGRIMKGDERLSAPFFGFMQVGEEYARKNCHFESKMEIHEHKAMNDFLNTALLESKRETGRVPLEYTHPKTIDSFKPLSAAGFQALPPSFKRHCMHSLKDLKLRTTTDQTTGAVTARIVKHKLSDFHIFNPLYEYDCRISLNLEAKLMPPPHDANPPEELMTLPSVAEMTDEWPSNSHAQPDREKDRLSYKHQIYQIDLTKVGGNKGSYELEIEVDAQVLREQMGKMEQGRPNGYAGIVDSFLGNATYLMRQRGVR